ncbi:MAG: hypothetical protein RR212_15050, partial [Bacteroidales bacterium]
VDRNDAGFRQAFQSIDMDLIKLTFDPVSNEVIASQSYSETVPDYIWKEIAPYFKNEIKIPIK